jgi:Crp-like helix-turn-helix domain
MCRWLLIMHDRTGPEALPYTHEFLSHILGADRKSVTLAAQSMQHAGFISDRRGKMQVLDRAGLEKVSRECYAVVRQRFDDFLKPPVTAVQGHNRGRSESRPGRTGWREPRPPTRASGIVRIGWNSRLVVLNRV